MIAEVRSVFYTQGMLGNGKGFESGPVFELSDAKTQAKCFLKFTDGCFGGCNCSECVCDFNSVL